MFNEHFMYIYERHYHGTYSIRIIGYVDGHKYTFIGYTQCFIYVYL